MEQQKKFCELYNIDAEKYKNISIDRVGFPIKVLYRLHRAGIEKIGTLLNCMYAMSKQMNGFEWV